MHLSGRQDKNGVRRRLFERLQQRVESGCRKHVHFVNNVNFEAGLVGGEIDLIAQVAHIFNAGVRGGVNFDQIHKAALVDRLAMQAGIAGPFGQLWLQAVDRFGQQTGGSGLAGAARASEQESMRHPVGGDGIAQRLHDVLLANHLVPLGRTPFTIQCLRHT